MAVSNPATLASVQAEFGGPGDLRSYYRGGPYVPNGPAQNNNISTDPNSLNLASFAGAVRYALTASISPQSISNTVTNSSSSATVRSGLATVYPSGGSGNYSYYWNYSAAAPVNGNTGQTFQLQATFGTTGYLEFDWNCVVTDNVTGQQVVATAQRSYLQKQYESPPPTCVVIEALMFDGRTAGEYEMHDPILLADPYNNTAEVIEVSQALTYLAPSVTLVTRSGARLSCSTSAPIPIRAKKETLVRAENALGYFVAVTEHPNEMSPVFEWDEVIDVIQLGERLVRHIFVYEKCFWASDDGEQFILHHNTTGKNIL